MVSFNLCFIAVVIALVGSVESFSHSRIRRGASVYPVFGTGGHSSPTSHGPPPLASYVGATPPGGHGGSSGGGSYNPQNTGSALDSNLLNSYSQSNHGPPTPPSSSSGGWTPITGHGTGLSGGSSSGYGGSFYTPHFGLLSPSFAQGGGSHSTPPAQQSHTPSLSANSLAQSAQTSFYAQNNYFDVLLAGAPRPSYKGSFY